MPKQTFFNLPKEKREHILEIAVDEFAEKGYKLASISNMVAQAGIAKGSFYQYFEDKDDLYIYIVKTMIADRKLQVYKQEKEKLKELSLTEFLRVVFRRQTQEFMEQPKLFKIGLDIMQLVNEPVYQKMMTPYKDTYNTYFLEYIRHEVAQGEIDPKINAELLNFMLISIGQYLMYLFTLPGAQTLTMDVIDKLADDLEYIFTNGIYLREGKEGD